MKKQVPVSCKIGTQPALVYIDRRQTPHVGKIIRVRSAARGSKWEEVMVDKINDDGYFFASKI
jgi:hypothetical protein